MGRLGESVNGESVKREIKIHLAGWFLLSLPTLLTGVRRNA